MSSMTLVWKIVTFPLATMVATSPGKECNAISSLHMLGAVVSIKVNSLIPKWALRWRPTFVRSAVS